MDDVSPIKYSIIKCIIDNVNNLPVTSCIETGENLQMISFYYKNFKLSMGAEELTGATYKYLENGIEMELPSTKNLIIYIAWLEMEDTELEDVFTWYAADPTM